MSRMHALRAFDSQPFLTTDMYWYFSEEVSYNYHHLYAILQMSV